jgi:adhesin transport system outer membrane protein
MILKPIVLAIASLGFVSFQACAQVSSNLKDAVEKAVLQNPETKFRYQNLAASRSEQDAAKGAYLPRIDLIDAAVGRYRAASPTLGDRAYNGANATLQLRQTLFDGKATASEVRRLGHSRLVAYYELMDSSDQIALETIRTYLDVQRYRETLVLARDNYAAHVSVHQKISERVRSGVGRRVDLEQAAGRLALAESNWLTEASNLHDVTVRYQRLTGDTPSATLAPLPPLDSYVPARAQFLETAISHNPQFLGAVSTIRSYQADLDGRKAANWPTLELRARQSAEHNQDGVTGHYRNSALELVLNYNLYHGGSDSARVSQFAAKLNAAYDLRDKTCRDLSQTAQIAFNDIQRQGQQISLLSQHELSTAKAHEAYRQQFDIGQRSLLDLLDTENELFQARRSLANAGFDLQLAKARVLAASGNLLSALQLRPLETEMPPVPGGISENDALLQCNLAMPEPIELDKTGLPSL